MSFLKAKYKVLSRDWKAIGRPGIFSLVEPQRLQGIASRSQASLERYGEKAIERVMEEQLTLILQSFGFFVIPAPRARRQIDLICISDSPLGPAVVLVEAKTSAKRYGLPAKDGRALREYIQSVKTALTGLPPLKLVLIVGPEPTSTIKQKLQNLENECGIAVRYSPAAVIAKLRKVLVGPVPTSPFINEAIKSQGVLGQAFLEAVQERRRNEAAAYTDFVQQMLTSRSD